MNKEKTGGSQIAVCFGIRVLAVTLLAFSGQVWSADGRQGRKDPRVEQAVEKAREYFRKQQNERFKKQKNRDRLEWATGNGWLPVEYRPLEGGVVLVAVRLRRWELQSENGGGQIWDSGFQSRIEFKVSGKDAALLPLGDLKLPLDGSLQPQGSVKVYADRNDLAGVWLLVPKGQKTLDIQASLIKEGERADFCDDSPIRMSIQIAKATGGEKELAAEFLRRRAFALTTTADVLVESEEEVADSMSRKKQTKKLRKLESKNGQRLKDVGGSPQNAGLPVLPPISGEFLAKFVLDPHWSTSCVGHGGRLAIVRKGDNGPAEVNVYDPKHPEAGMCVNVFLVDSSGVLGPMINEEDDAVQAKGRWIYTTSRNSRFDRSAGVPKEYRRLKSRVVDTESPVKTFEGQ